MIKTRYARWIELVLLLILAVILAGMTTLERQQQTLSAELIRLHVTADSDESQDQQIKLIVRDAILTEADNLLAEATDRQQAKYLLLENLSDLESTANGVLREYGVSDTATVTLKRELFGTRFYNGYTLPGGYYDALRVEIGSGEGKNWWCVVYPQICTAAVTKPNVQAVMAPAEDIYWILAEDELEEYKLRFKLLELFENLAGWFRSGTEGIPDSG